MTTNAELRALADAAKLAHDVYCKWLKDTHRPSDHYSENRHNTALALQKACTYDRIRQLLDELDAANKRVDEAERHASHLRYLIALAVFPETDAAVKG